MANVRVDAPVGMLDGRPTWLFFYRGKRRNQATDWRRLGPLDAAVAAERERFGGQCGREHGKW